VRLKSNEYNSFRVTEAISWGARSTLRDRRGFGLGHDLLDFDTASGDERGQRANSGRDRRDDAADNACRQGKLSDGPALLLHHDPADVAFFDEPLELREDLLGRTFELLPERAFHRFDPPENIVYSCIDEPRTGWFRRPASLSGFEPLLGDYLLPGMKLVVRRTQPRFEHVRVDLSRRQVGVPEHHLNHPQVGAAFE